jgi:hypothetical protein
LNRQAPPAGSQSIAVEISVRRLAYQYSTTKLDPVPSRDNRTGAVLFLHSMDQTPRLERVDAEAVLTLSFHAVRPVPFPKVSAPSQPLLSRYGSYRGMSVHNTIATEYHAATA